MSKTDLKQALERLEIKKPLRLPAPLSFSAPVAAGTSLSGDMPGSEVTAGSSANSVSSGQKGPSDTDGTPGELQAQDTPSSQGQSESPDPTSRIHRRSTSRAATDQDSAVTLINQYGSRLGNGYTRIPNPFLMAIVEGDLSKAEIKVLLLVARLTISFQRAMVPLSKTAIERMTGLQSRSVLEAVSSLESRKLLVKRLGNALTPNQLGLQGIDEFLGPRSSGQEGSPGEKPSEEVGGKGSPGSGKNGADIKDTQRDQTKHSLGELPDQLRSYIEQLKPQRKRESELQAFRELRKDYSAEEISNCVVHLLERGLPGSGSSCHSPLAFLATAMPSILVLVEDERQRQERRIRNARTAEAVRAAEEIENRESAERVAAFERAFPTEEARDRVFSQFHSRYPMLSVNGPALRNLAIQSWAESEGPNCWGSVGGGIRPGPPSS